MRVIRHRDYESVEIALCELFCGSIAAKFERTLLRKGASTVDDFYVLSMVFLTGTAFLVELPSTRSVFENPASTKPGEDSGKW